MRYFVACFVLFCTIKSPLPRWADARLRVRTHPHCQKQPIGKPKPHKSDCTAYIRGVLNCTFVHNLHWRLNAGALYCDFAKNKHLG